jgi:hypothetical protein
MWRKIVEGVDPAGWGAGFYPLKQAVLAIDRPRQPRDGRTMRRIDMGKGCI